MAGEQDAVEVVGLALEPVGAGKDRRDRRHRRLLVGHHLDADARVLARAEQVVDDVEALLAARPVDAADVGEVDEGEPRVVAQEGARTARSRSARDRHGQLADTRRCHSTIRVAAGGPAAIDLAERSLRRLVQTRRAPAFSVRSCRCAGSSSAEAARRRAAPRPSAGSPERRCRPARCGRSRAPRSRNSGSSRRHWRRSPWR